MTRTSLTLILLAIGIAGIAVAILTDGVLRAVSIVIALLAVGMLIVLQRGFLTSSSEHVSENPDDFASLDEARIHELIRGTSQFLSAQHYRYSVRSDRSDSSDRRAFTAEVNGIRLGFIPAVVTDTASDRQGFGYVAVVHDGHRWRGPGLPCPAGQVEAVRHAARCVAPLATEEETKFDIDDQPDE